MNYEFILIIAVIYIVLNGVSFFLFASDKKKAVNNEFRIKESTLLISGFLGPFGAVDGMRVFRHKTKKRKFYLIYVFLILHTAAIIFIFWKFCL
ncbi:MAG: DUF1294 domain-containing protein [Methanomassiliicoccaceae archaeon]|nr:DUF1294 domain-containing protein [Methanomassiliicoccaceae archaeon]